MRRLGCWLLAAGLVVLGCLAASGCSIEYESDPRHASCVAMGGISKGSRLSYEGCDFPPQPCGPLPAEAP